MRAKFYVEDESSGKLTGLDESVGFVATRCILMRLQQDSMLHSWGCQARGVSSIIFTLLSCGIACMHPHM